MSIFNVGRNNSIVNSSIISGNGTCIVNGKKIDVPSNANVSIINNKVFVNGKEYKDEEVSKSIEDCKEIKIEIHGNVEKLDIEGCEVTVNGDVDTVEAGNQCEVKITGDIKHNLDCGNQCTINTKSVIGDVDCGNMCTINVDKVSGDIDTGNMCNVNRR